MLLLQSPIFAFFPLLSDSFYSTQDKIESVFKIKLLFYWLSWTTYSLKFQFSMGSSNLASAADLSFALVSLERLIREAALVLFDQRILSSSG